MSGDFGVKSEVVAAAFKEPEYHGSDTVVVPLYIPRGAIPIRLARIARSGSPDVFPLVDMKVSASEDSLLLRRVGSPHQGRRLPPSSLMNPPWRSRSDKNDKTRQLVDIQTPKNDRTPPPPSPTPSIYIRGYGQRIKNSKDEVNEDEDSSNGKEETEQDTTKRTKKNELSKDSQFPGEIFTTDSSIIQTNNNSASQKIAAETTTSPHLLKNSSIFKEISSSTEPIIDVFSLTNNVTSLETTTFIPLKRITKFIPLLIATTTAVPEKKTTFDGHSSSIERPEHHSVLFPKPVESILKSSQSIFRTSTPSTTASTTTEIYNNNTRDASKIPLRNKIRIRPWLSRTQSSTSTSSTTTTPPHTSTLTTTTTASITNAATSTTITTTPTTTTTTTTTSTTITDVPTTTNSPLRKIIIPRLSATTKKLQLITQKPPALPIKLVTPNIKPPVIIRKEIKSLSSVNSDSKFPQPSTTKEILETNIENNAKTPNKTNSDQTEIKPIELLTLKENIKKEGGEERLRINLSDSTRAVEENASNPPLFMGIVNQEPSLRPGTRRVRKPIMVDGRPIRRRRLFRQSTTPAPSSITNEKDLFSLLSTKSTLLPVTEMPFKRSTINSKATTIMPKSVGERLAFKTHEQVVLESLSEIMKDATNHSKDRVSNIAADLEALNKRLAEKNIFIINAEVDGVKIKLNKTFARGTYSFPTTSKPHSSFNPPIPTRKSTILTRNPTTTDISLSSVAFRLIPEDGESEKHVQTSVKSSFSMHTSKTTDIEDETEADNEVRSTTLNSYFITPKSIDSQKDDDKPIRSDFTYTPTSIVSSIESLSEDSVGSNNSDALLKSTNKSKIQSIKTFLATHPPENESLDESSVFISATATVPAHVTTRTRSTTVPINIHRPTLKPLIVTHKDRYRKIDDNEVKVLEEFLDKSHENDTNEDPISDLEVPSELHPTSHLRPIQTSSPSASIALNTGTISDSTTSSETKPPFFSVKEDQTDPSDLQVSAVEILNYDSTPETKSSTTIYIVAVIGIIPGAVAVAFFVKRYLNKDEKSLPEAEEQAEGFTPVTHHSRKPSQSNTMPVAHDSPGSRSSTELPSAQYTKTPWEFPRSKLRLVSVLGEGNFGVVWKAEARDLCGCGENGTGGPTVLVAVKSVKDGAGLKEREDLIKELDIMQHLGQHPNVVTLLGCCTQTEPHLVIMEYVMFGKLLTFLRDVRTRHKYYNFSADNEALTSKDLTRFACDVASGCEYLQSRGVIHLRLYQRPFFVEINNFCELHDFGTQRRLRPLRGNLKQRPRRPLLVRWPLQLLLNLFLGSFNVKGHVLFWDFLSVPNLIIVCVSKKIKVCYRVRTTDYSGQRLFGILNKCFKHQLNNRSLADLRADLQYININHGCYAITPVDFLVGQYYPYHHN
ncbi:unnamed protein product, partial [Meganyctiphanes norvegica]